MRLIILTLVCKGLLISDRCHVRFATLVEKTWCPWWHTVHMNQLENCQARYRLNTWMGRTRTDGPDEFEPWKFDCIWLRINISYAGSYKYNLEFKTWHCIFERLTVKICLFWCYTSQSTAMVMSERSVHLTTFFPGQALASMTKRLSSTSCT